MKITCYDSSGTPIRNLRQWELNRTIRISDIECGDNVVAHIYNDVDGCAEVVPVVKEEMAITTKVPNKMLQETRPIVVGLFEESAEPSLEGRYLCSFNIPVIPTAKPADYEFVENIEYTNWIELTEEAQRILDSLIEGTKSLQSDWNQNDETKPDFIKNRPFYTSDPVETVWLEEQTITTNDNGTSMISPFDKTITPDTKYVVTIDGVSTEYTSFILQDTLCFGAPQDIQSGEPNFPLFGVTEGALLCALPPNVSSVVSIKEVAVNITKIDEKYLPKMIGKSGSGFNSEVFNSYLSNVASGYCAHAEGENTQASNFHSHAEGNSTTASGEGSHAEGSSTTASGYCAHAEGGITTASGDYSHAEGYFTTASVDYSHAEGGSTTASGYYSHAEGTNAIASGNYSHAEGYYTTASGECSHAEGNSCEATGCHSHVEGKHNIPDTDNGTKTGTPLDKYAHIVGNGHYNPLTRETVLSNAHTLDWEGNGWYQNDVLIGGENMDDPSAISLKSLNNTLNSIPNISKGQGALSEAFNGISSDRVKGKNAHIEGDQSYIKEYKNATVSNIDPTAQTYALNDIPINKDIFPHIIELSQNGDIKFTFINVGVSDNYGGGHHSSEIHNIHSYSDISQLTEGIYDIKIVSGMSIGDRSHVEGNTNIAISRESHVEGWHNIATEWVDGSGKKIGDGVGAHVEGHENKAVGRASHAEGRLNKAIGTHSHAEGMSNEATGKYSHVEGNNSLASGKASHAEGDNTKALEWGSHAEGVSTQAIGINSHAEGAVTKAIGENSHAEGYYVEATGESSHAEGGQTEASGRYSHAEGRRTIASGDSSHVEGRFNINDTQNKYVHIVGNGIWNEGHRPQDKPTRSNAHTLDWQGNSWYQGDVLIGGKDMDDPAAISLKKINDKVTKAPTIETNGLDGQIAISDGNGGLKWLTIAELKTLLSQVQ